MAGGGASSGDFLKGFPQVSSGTGADNPQATSAMGLHPSVAPWMMGQMGQQMMQAGQMHPQQAPTLAHHGPPGLIGGMSMPNPPMGGQQLTPTTINQALLHQTGLMGRPF